MIGICITPTCRKEYNGDFIDEAERNEDKCPACKEASRRAAEAVDRKIQQLNLANPDRHRSERAELIQEALANPQKIITLNGKEMGLGSWGS